MKSFTIGERYGLVPFEETNCGMFTTKEQWNKLRAIGVRVTGCGGGGVYIEPWCHIEGNTIFIVDSDYICDWKEPSLDEWGARAVRNLNFNEQYPSLYISTARGGGKTELMKRMLNYQYGMHGGHWCVDDLVNYCKNLEFEHSSDNWPNYCMEDAKMAYDYYRFSSRANAIKDVKFNGPATIVFWGDGTKTIVKARNGEPNDPEKAIAMCIAKHFMGSNKSGSNYYDNIKKWLPKEEKALEPIGTVEEKEITEDGVKVKAKMKVTAEYINEKQEEKK